MPFLGNENDVLDPDANVVVLRVDSFRSRRNVDPGFDRVEHARLQRLHADVMHIQTDRMTEAMPVELPELSAVLFFDQPQF